MDEKIYDEVIAWCQRMITKNDLMLYRVHEYHTTLVKASTQFHIPKESLESLFRHVHLRHFKKVHYQLPSMTLSIIQFYVDNPMLTIIDVARKYHFPPSVMARLILEQVITDFPSSSSSSSSLKGNNDTTSNDIQKENYNDSYEYDVDDCNKIKTIQNLTTTTTITTKDHHESNSLTNHHLSIIDSSVEIIHQGKVKHDEKQVHKNHSFMTTTTTTTQTHMTPPSLIVSSSLSSSTHQIKKSSNQKKLIRNALQDPLTVLGGGDQKDIRDILRPIYQSSSLVMSSFDPSSSSSSSSSLLQKRIDPWIGFDDPSIIMIQSSLTLIGGRDCSNHKNPCSRNNKLALDVWEAMEQDPMYGPRHDRMNTIIGIEYELALEDILRSMNIPFESERELRERGTAKTPDILLKCPIAIQIPRRVKKKVDKQHVDIRQIPSLSLASIADTNIQHLDDKTENSSSKTTNHPDSSEQQEDDNSVEWQIIQWIDSKAYFGDEHTHKTLVLQQAESYVHRFGPGLILYWFGHAPLNQLDHGSGDVFIIGWSFPHSCLFPAEILVQYGYPFIDT